MASAKKGTASAARGGAVEVLDVAVIGGGVSGVYAGWRLLTGAGGKKPKSIGLFESSWRLGGRLLSLVPPGIPNTKVEVGGMRFTSSHLMVSGLVRFLGFNAVPFSVYEPQNVAFLRGKMLRSQDLTDATKLPYNLLPDETDVGFLTNVTASAAQRALRLILKKDVPPNEVTDMWGKIAKTAKYEGRHLRDISMRYLIDRAISIEAFRFNEDSSGYDSILYTWNAVDGFPWNLADYGRSVTYSHLPDGYETVPLEVARRFEQAGGSIHLEHQLVGFDEVKRGGETMIELEIKSHGGKKKTVFARDLILAMPRRSLDLLDQRGAVLGAKNKAVHDLIASVTPVPLFKIAMCYPFPWWQTIAPVAVPGQPQMVQITQGQSITDLPIRQCYYWAVDPQTQNAVVLVYDDGQDLDFWAALRKKHDDQYPTGVDDPSSKEFGLQSWSRFPAPRIMVEEVHRMLCRMHCVEDRADIPKPYAAAFRDWGEDPFGGGANFWHLHVDSEHVSTAILQPKPPTRVFICGEAYSHQQGWVEGALQTTELMLEKHFGLKPPKWLPPGAVSGSA